MEWEVGKSGIANASPFDPPRSKPFPMPPLPVKGCGVVFERGARKMGWHPFPRPMAILSKSRPGRSACVNCGFCLNFGLTAFNGQQGWLSIPAHTHIMSAAENDAARIDADLYFAANVKSLYQKFSVAGGEKIGAHETWLVVGRSEGKPLLRLYLDKDSGLLLRLVRYAETPLGRNPTQIDYADYRSADGVKIPFRWTLARPGGNRFTIQIDQTQQNVPVDAAKFALPPPSASPDAKP